VDAVRAGLTYRSGVESISGEFAAPRRAVGYDALLVLGAAAVQVVGTVFASHHQPNSDPLDAFGYLLLAAGPASLILRRRWPVAVLAATFAATFGYLLLGYPGGPIWLSLIIAFVTVVLRGQRIVAYTSLALGFLLSVWLDPLVRGNPGPAVAQALGIAAWLLALAAGGEVLRYRRALRAAAVRQAIEVRHSEEEAARRRASDERLDIARELHDVLAHSISMINVQAGVALELMDERPEQARTSLATIKQASKDALVEVQAVLGALREAGEAATTTPAPSVADLGRLLSGARSAGLQVNVRVDGETYPLPVGTDLAAYRILQESLTNVVRHARASTVDVTVSYRPRELSVEVVDDGRPPANDGRPPANDRQPPSARGRRNGARPGGSGIAGMRERAVALGGELEAGRHPAGGFRVVARLPLERGDA
jgi:signal transduction histidine kinase